MFRLQVAGSPADLPGRTALRRYALAALERDAEVTLRLVGAAEGRRLNEAYRGKPVPTNVLTFVYDDGDRVSGDIVLCVPVLRREARAQGKRLTDHCAHLVVHGMLHLQGYDHDRPSEAEAMERKETAILAAFGMPDPYADPPHA